jgi:hypothetical protein
MIIYINSRKDGWQMKIKTVTIKKGYTVRSLGGEFCIVYEDDSNNGTVNGIPSINETGIFLWARLENGDTPEDLINSLIEKHDIDYDDALEDVGEFLAKLINGNIVEITH